MAKSCHRVLGVPMDADEATVRKAYLELVRRYPPEQCPAEFAEVRAAYEALIDPMKYLKRQILKPDASDSLEDIATQLRERIRGNRIPLDTLLSLGNN
jgi:DnaJ-class molecular chaperone